MLQASLSAPSSIVSLLVTSTLLLPMLSRTAAEQKTNHAKVLPASMFTVPEGLEVTFWASTPLLQNPTSIDTDKQGRIWAAEGVNYGAKHYQRHPQGDRIVVIEDRDGDGIADKSWTFVQDPALRAPLGLAVIDHQIIVSMAPNLIVYTDVDRDQKFDPAVDKREVLLTGFNGHNHDHGLHSLTAGPDGLWYWSMGNCGAVFIDKSNRTFRIGSPYDIRYGMTLDMDPRDISGQRSDDGRVYLGGFAARMRPDGSKVEIIAHNFRNSYEHTVNSFGDVFQNDNDDPPACRTSFVMLHGNAGYASLDGRRTWQADRRPGQSVAIAEWRQEDPGVMPAGDVYGGGSPTGIAYYENGALGEAYAGTLLSGEAGRNAVFSYQPQSKGAGFKLERRLFLASNPQDDVNSSEFGNKANADVDAKFLFRPSDIVVGADGAVYVSDWYDPMVGGGHKYLDEAAAGAIYRIAPKGFKPQLIPFDDETIEGQIEGLKNPANHVRAAAAVKLRARGIEAIDALTNLVEDPNANPYFKARAIWVLSDLGEAGSQKISSLIHNRSKPELRVTAYRALSRHATDIVSLAHHWLQDSSPALRREIALSLRDVPFEKSKDLILKLAESGDAEDATLVEAIGTAAEGQESVVYDALAIKLAHADPLQWSPWFARLAWRLHPPQVVHAMKARALASALKLEDRRSAMVALGSIATKEAAWAMADIANEVSDPLKAEAIWWLLNRKNDQWKHTGLEDRLKKDGIYDPEKIHWLDIQVPPAPPTQLPEISEILKLQGNAQRGQMLAGTCTSCHRIQDQGIDYGPDITAYAKMQPPEVVLRALITPSSEVAHGYEGSAVITHDGKEIHGMILSHQDPIVIRSQGGLTQMIPAAQIKSVTPLRRSLMLSAEQLGLGAQQLADLLAYLKSL